MMSGVSNIMQVKKKNGKMRVCCNYRNLNKATPKDEYFMPMANQLVDVEAMNTIMSFMDDNVGYYQVFIVDEDRHKTALQCPRSIRIFE